MNDYIEKLQKRAAKYNLLGKKSEDKTGPGHVYRNGYLDGAEEAILSIIEELQELQEFQKNTAVYIRVNGWDLRDLESLTNHKPVEDESSGSL